MKKFLLFIGMAAIVAVVLSACQSKPASQTLSFVDTAGLAQFQSWKAMNEKVPPVQPIVVVNQQAPAPVKKKASTKTQSGSMNTLSTHEGKVAEKKKGWSKAATYSAIGGGAGIALGAVVHKKNRVLGGAIGGAVLGGLGYLIGRSQDKKDGRY